MNMTVSELAARLQPISGTSLEGLQRQLRAWTETGALSPADGVFIGTGRARRYSDDDAILAVLAIGLAWWGVPIGTIRLITSAQWFQLNHEEHSALREIKEGRSDCLLVALLRF